MGSESAKEAITPSGKRRRLPGMVAVVLIVAAIAAAALLWRKCDDGADKQVTSMGKLEVTALLLDTPKEYPQYHYPYTLVMKYRVLKIHRKDAAGKYPLAVGDVIYVGHYRPMISRKEVAEELNRDDIGGRLVRFVQGDVHRMALEYELEQWTPEITIDEYPPPRVNRFFAVWTNPASE